MTGARHLQAAGYVRVPWRNGGGVTAEIAVAPAGATLASGFDWRLSCADVAASGAFSAFAGYDRILVQLSGAPMQLVGAVATTLQVGEAYAFAGEEALHGIVSEPVKDFNCIVQRGLYTGQVDTLRLAGDQVQRHAVDADVTAVFMASGAAHVDVGDVRYELAPMDTLLLETAASELASVPQVLHHKACGAPCVILLVNLRRRG